MARLLAGRLDTVGLEELKLVVIEGILIERGCELWSIRSGMSTVEKRLVVVRGKSLATVPVVTSLVASHSSPAVRLLAQKRRWWLKLPWFFSMQ